MLRIKDIQSVKVIKVRAESGKVYFDADGERYFLMLKIDFCNNCFFEMRHKSKLDKDSTFVHQKFGSEVDKGLKGKSFNEVFNNVLLAGILSKNKEQVLPRHREQFVANLQALDFVE